MARENRPNGSSWRNGLISNIFRNKSEVLITVVQKRRPTEHAVTHTILVLIAFLLKVLLRQVFRIHAGMNEVTKQGNKLNKLQTELINVEIMPTKIKNRSLI